MMSDKEPAFPCCLWGWRSRGGGGGEHSQEARERVWYREVGAPAQLASLGKDE